MESLVLNLTEIPTVSVLETLRRGREEAAPPLASTPASIREKSLERVEIALTGFQLPPPARILQKQIVTSLANPLEVKIIYLSDERISPEMETTILGKIRQGLNDDSATVDLERLAGEIGVIDFSPDKFELPLAGMLQLDFVGRMLRDIPNLDLAAAIGRRTNEPADIAAGRARSIIDYLETRWQIEPARVKVIGENVPLVQTLLRFDPDQRSGV